MKRLLDVGCGPGAIVSVGYYKKLKNTKIFGIDNLKKNLLLIKKRFPEGTFKYAHAEKLPFPNAYFDYILARHILEHVDDIDKSLNEIKRVSKKGATVMIAVPHYRMENTLRKLDSHYLGEGHHHKRMINKTSLENLLKKHGFQIKKISNQKWPLFIYTVSLMYISKKTNKIEMEEQTGSFRFGDFRYLQAKLLYPFLDVVSTTLNAFNAAIPFLNNFIPFEIEVYAEKK